MWSQVIMGWGQMEEVALFCHQSWPLVLSSLGKKFVNVSFLGLLCSCLRPDQVQTDSGKDRKLTDMGFTSQTELLPPPRFYLWNA